MSKYGNRLHYQVDKDNFLTLTGKFSGKNIEDITFPKMMQDLVLTQKHIIDFIHKALAGDGRLLGQEKVGLSILVDTLIYTVLAMRLRLDEEEGVMPVSFEAGPVASKYARYNYNAVDEGFRISCKVSERVLAGIPSFSDWFNAEFKNKISKFFSLVKKTMEDYEIDEIEKIDLIEELHAILYSLIMASWKVKSRNLDS